MNKKDINNYYQIIYNAILIIHCIDNNLLLFINDYKITLYQYTNNKNILNKDLNNKDLKKICLKIIANIIYDAIKYNE